MLDRRDSWSEALSDVVWIRYVNLLVNVPVLLRLNPKMHIKIIYVHILPDIKIWPFKSQVSAAAVSLFNSNAQYSTAFCLFAWKGWKINGTALFISHIQFNDISPEVDFEYMPGYCAASKLAAPPFIVLYAPACNIFRVFEHWKLLTGSFPHIDRCSVYAWFLFLLSVLDV